MPEQTIQKIDIVIPVYRGLSQARDCLDSVFAAQNHTLVDIIVIDDASPEPALSAYLTELAVQGKITLLVNAANLGFVQSVNRGMQQHLDRDVLLLNSDTRVSRLDWLDRMHRCLYSHALVASVTPLSNNATICSYPVFAQSNALVADVAALDSHCAKANNGLSVDIPTAVGFCMLIRRSVLNEVGLFNAEQYGKGYGEENDWCLRAVALGYRHLLCADTFVYHQGEVSFADTADSSKQAAQVVLDAAHPDYAQLIGDFVVADPARPLRRNVDMARLRASPRPKLLMVTHHWGGGTERHVRELAALLQDDCEVLLLQPVEEDQLELRWLNTGEAFSAFFDSKADWPVLLDLLRSLPIDRLHVHHVHGLPLAVLSLADDLQIPLDITLHDYFLLSSRYFPLHGGAFDEQDMQAAASQHPWGISLADWQSRMHHFAARAERVICPSQDIADRMSRFLPDLKYRVWPHPQAEAPLPALIKILVLGGLTKDKGLDIVLACAVQAKEKKLSVVFKVMGHSALSLPQWPDLPILVHGSYREEELPALLALERPDGFMFPAQLPETFSYTLTSAMQTGLPIVASRLGAFPERLQDYPQARLLDWNAPANKWLDAALSCGNDTQRVVPSASDHVGSQAGSQVVPYAAYRLRYLESIIAQQARTHHTEVLLDAETKLAPRHYYFFAKREPAPHTLVNLYINGIECGHRATRDELKRRIGIVDAEVADLNIALQQAREAFHQRDADVGMRDKDIELLMSQIALVESERDAARAAYLEIEGSTSWRMTGPLRWLVWQLKSTKSRIRNILLSVRRAPYFLAMSAQILKEQGLVALLRRVLGKLQRRSTALPVTGSAYETATAITTLAMPHSDTPRFSIVIPVYEQHLLTFTCLQSLANTCADMQVEIIVVDDCSPTPAEQALAAVSNVVWIRNETNLGFLKNCNKAAAAARGEYLVLLNNDTIATAGWLQHMVDVFAQHADAGLVGAKLMYPNGVLQEAGGIVWRDGSAWNWGRNDHPDKPEYNYVRRVDYCSGACLMIARSFWNDLCGFDERYAPAYYEDTDLAFKVRAAGRQAYYQPLSVIVHFEGQSSGVDTTSGIKQYQVTNQQKFYKKWCAVLGAHRLNGLLPALEKDRYDGKRVLVVDACMLTPDQDSGSLRMFEMLAALCDLGCKVTFVADNLEYRLPYVQQIQQLGVEVLYHPYLSSIASLIERDAKCYDVIVLSRISVACKYVKLIRQYAAKAKVIFDTVDLHFLRMERQAALSGDKATRVAASKMRTLELDVINEADMTLVVSPMEKNLLAQQVPHKPVVILSNIHVSEPGPATYQEREGIIFIGGFRHPPNLDAMTWYAEQVVPLLRLKLPGVVTTVIGSEAPPALERLASPELVIAGYIPDVQPIFGQARLSISPLRYGAGVKGKINLSMQYGVPVVATAISIEGMHLREGLDVISADTPEDFANAIVRVYQDAQLWQMLRQNGLDNIDKHFSRNAAKASLKQILEVL